MCYDTVIDKRDKMRGNKAMALSADGMRYTFADVLAWDEKDRIDTNFK